LLIGVNTTTRNDHTVLWVIKFQQYSKRKQLDMMLFPSTLMGYLRGEGHRLGWYLNFYVSWSYAINKNHISGHIVNYSEMKNDLISYFSNIASKYGEEVSNEEIQSAIEETNRDMNRFSKGIEGRGKNIMNSRQIAQMEETGERYKKYYPWLDFSPIGL